jgi:hypothetical protein
MPKRRRLEDATAEAPKAECFAVGALDRKASEAAKSSFAAATPYPHVHLRSMFDEAVLLQVRGELRRLQSTFKETDMFKVSRND